jgi:hypothetical protein
VRLVVFVQVLILITGISANAADRRVPPPHKPQPPATTAPSEPPTSGAGKFGGQTRGAGDDKTPAAGERGTEQSPFIVKVLPFPSTDWVAVFTAVLCTVGVLQLAVFGLQARRLKQTIQAMRATEMTQLRAYVGVERMEVILEQSQPSISVAGFHDLIHIGLKNFGVTPAYQVSCKTTLQEMKGKGRLPKGFVFSEMQPTMLIRLTPKSTRFSDNLSVP